MELSTNLNSHNSLISQGALTKKWVSPLKKEAYYGLAGDIVKTIEPHTEADPVGILVQLFAAFGNVIGKNPHFIAEDNYHALKVNPVLVGETAKGRKGVAWSRVINLFKPIASEWVINNVTSGLSSAEGLIWAVRDFNLTDEGIADKRLLVIEPEFATILRRTSNQGNTLSQIIRQSWDSGHLRSLTKNSPAQSTDAHITIIGHITKDELVRYLDKTEMANGFGNRFLWICVRRSKLLPEGGNLSSEALTPLIKCLKTSVDFAANVREIKRNEEAAKLWKEIYQKLSEDKLRMVGALTARGEPYVMRLACIYALLDCSELIRPEHLNAALAIWDYSEQSVIYIFGDKTGDTTTDIILTTLRDFSEGLNRTQISSLFAGHKPSQEITKALEMSKKYNLAESKIIATSGRSEEKWFAK